MLYGRILVVHGRCAFDLHPKKTCRVSGVSELNNRPAEKTRSGFVASEARLFSTSQLAINSIPFFCSCLKNSRIEKTALAGIFLFFSSFLFKTYIGTPCVILEGVPCHFGRGGHK